MNNKKTKIIIVFLAATIVLIGLGLLCYFGLIPINTSNYDLVFCNGDYDQLGEVKVAGDKIIGADSCLISPDPYSCGCYLFNTTNRHKNELTIQELNSLALISDEKSPDGYSIKKVYSNDNKGGFIEDTGLIPYKIFLFKPFVKEILVIKSFEPDFFKFIGWVDKNTQ